MHTYDGHAPRFLQLRFSIVSFLVVIATLLLTACGGSGTSSRTNARSAASPSSPEIVVDQRLIYVPEGGEAYLRVRLAVAPATGNSTTVTITRVRGDTDLQWKQIAGLTFTESNWSTDQILTLGAANDSDTSNSESVIRLEAPGMPAYDVLARELDDDTVGSAIVPIVDGDKAVLVEGGQAQVNVKLNVAPPVGTTTTVDLSIQGRVPSLSIKSPTQITFDETNWSQYQTVTLGAASDADKCNERGSLIVQALGAGRSIVAVSIGDNQRSANSGGFAVCGSFRAPDSAIMDKDVNEPGASTGSNNTAASAQVIPNPATIGGFVNAPATGPSGGDLAGGDPSDFFRGSLLAGQTVTLYAAADTSEADIELRLYDAATGVLVDADTSTSSTKQIPIRASGDYVIEVHACQKDEAECVAFGASKYVVVVGQVATLSRTSSMLLSADFVPGEAIVKFDSSRFQARSLGAVQSDIGMVAVAGVPERSMLFRVDSQAVNQVRALRGKVATSAALPFANDKQKRKYETLRALRSLRARNDVVFAEPNMVVKPLAVPTDPFYVNQWHYPIINLPAAWDITTGSNVVVAVIDTGVLLQHPDLQGQTIAGYDFIRDVNNAVDGDGIDPNPDDPGDQGPNGSSFHGSHVSGTVAASTNNGVGVAGIAWNSKIMPLRVLGKLGGSEYDVQQALLFAAGLPNDSKTVPPKKADIVNMSFGGTGFLQSTQAIVDQVRQAGVILIAAAGNDGNNVPSYPASYNGVVSVSAVDSQKKLASYSSFGATVDVAAPGGDITLDLNGDGLGDGVLSTGGSDRTGVIQFRYPVFEGTSMASPHMAGVAALMKSVFPGLTPVQFDQLLASGKITDDLGAAGRDDQYGNGLINAQKAVNEARLLGGGVPPPPPPVSALTANPATLNFSFNKELLTLAVSEAGAAGPDVVKVVSDQPWLTISAAPNGVDGLGLGDYLVKVSRGTLSTGAYTGTIAVTRNGVTVSVSVRMEVTAISVTADAGLHHVVLLDPQTHTRRYETTARAVDGVYTFELAGVTPGVYHLFAFTDSDYNRGLCEVGEACGAYASIEQPNSVIVSDSDVSGLMFSTAFLYNLGAAAK